MITERIDLQAALCQVEVWNLNNRPGSRVAWRKDGAAGEGETTSRAWPLSGTPVVSVAGVGIVCLADVGPVDETEPEPVVYEPAVSPVRAALHALEALQPFLRGEFHAVPVSMEYGAFLDRFDDAVELLRKAVLM